MEVSWWLMMINSGSKWSEGFPIRITSGQATCLVRERGIRISRCGAVSLALHFGQEKVKLIMTPEGSWSLRKEWDIQNMPHELGFLEGMFMGRPDTVSEACCASKSQIFIGAQLGSSYSSSTQFHSLCIGSKIFHSWFGGFRKNRDTPSHHTNF